MTIIRYVVYLRSIMLCFGITCSIRAGDPIDWNPIYTQGVAEISASKDKWDVESGSFAMTTDMPTEPQITCYYSRPVAADKSVSPRINDVVYFFHTPGIKEGNILDNGLCNALVKRNGMTVFALAFVKSSAMGVYFGNDASREKYYTFAKSGSFKAMLQAWSLLRRKFTIDQTKFFLYGYSAGGIGTQQFAEEYPEYTAGVVSVNGHTFSQKNRANNPFLFLHSHGDTGLIFGVNVATYYRRIGTPCINYFLSPNWKQMEQGNDFAFHALNGDVTTLALTYLEALSDLRRKGNKREVPVQKTWPYVMVSDNPLQIYKNTFEINEIAVDGVTKNLEAVPSAKFYAALLRVPALPMMIGTKEDPVYLARCRLDKVPSKVILMVKPRAMIGLDMIDRFSDAAFSDAQYIAEGEMTSVIGTSFESVMRLAGKATNGQPVNRERMGLILHDPSIELLRQIAGLPNMPKNFVVQYNEAVEITSILEVFGDIYKKGVRMLVLLNFQNREAYDKALSDVNKDLRSKIFPAFESLGGNAKLSLHQQHMQATRDFLLDKKAD